MISAPRFGVRHLFAGLAFMGFANVYAMRVNLSVAIVAMVNSTAVDHLVHRVGEPPAAEMLQNLTLVKRPHLPPTPYLRWPASSYLAADHPGNFTICMSDVIIGNRTDDAGGGEGGDGPFVWTQTDQSVILGCFFYG